MRRAVTLPHGGIWREVVEFGPVSAETRGYSSACDDAWVSTDVAPLSVDGMESIDVPGLDVAPLEVPAIGEE